MELDDSLKELERALSDLRRVRDSTTAWSDEVRQRFDDQRLAPIEEAGTRLIAAIRKTQEQFSTAQRLIGRQSD
jgi:hypothetical protein